MKKGLTAALALLMGASLASAGLAIQWGSGNGWMVAYGADLNEGPSVAENNEVIWQLIHAGSDNVAADPDLSADNYLGGDDILLADRQIPAGGGGAADGTVWDGWLMLQAGDTTFEDSMWFGEGCVYQRIWQGTPSEEEGGKYYQTDLFAIDTGSSSPQEFSFDPVGNGVAVNRLIGDPEPPTGVPEPATTALLGLGALAMVLRRRCKP